MAKRAIIIIPPKYMDEPVQLKHLRVTAYCRVSTATEEQSSSLESQILYYTAKIAENPLWTMQAFTVRRLPAEIRRNVANSKS